MDKELTKLYYSIGEVAELFELAPSLLRYWQNEFPGLRPGTNRKGDRRYTKKDIQYIEKIYELVKVKAYTLEGARKILAKDKSKNNDPKKELRAKLESVKKNLEILLDELTEND